jgi:peptidyl-prolyl cis-trans isomerase D
MVKPFNDFVFSNPVGKNWFRNRIWFHIINGLTNKMLLDWRQFSQKNRCFRSYIKRNTKKAQFEMESENKDFAAAAKKQGLTVMPSLVQNQWTKMLGHGGKDKIVK